jgi:hypothetical protein
VPIRATIRQRYESALGWVAGLPVLRQDALLYLLAGVFAAGQSILAVTPDYREWGRIAVAPYLAAAATCEVVLWLRRRGARPVREGEQTSRFRKSVVVVLLAATVLVPLGLQVTWRAEATGPTNARHAQAQPEVAVIERAGDRFDRFQDFYLAHPTTVGVSPSNDSKSVDASSYFPYLPGMVPFGMLNGVDLPHELNDARVPLSVFTLVVVLLSLALSPASSRRRWRTFQFLVILPTGALPMVTGGDDLPVLALLLLGLVFLKRRQPVAAGIVMGIAGSLKWTAWPLILLTLWCVADEDERRAIGRYTLSVLVVAVPIVGAGAALGTHAFLENVIVFPLGLTKVHSPAASPLPGQILVQLFPAEKTALTAALVSAGVLVVLAMLVRHPPRSTYQAAIFAGGALAFATLIAPATRFGYFIYPANMFVWGYLLYDSREPGSQLVGPPDDLVGQLASSTC